MQFAEVWCVCILTHQAGTFGVSIAILPLGWRGNISILALLRRIGMSCPAICLYSFSDTKKGALVGGAPCDQSTSSDSGSGDTEMTSFNVTPSTLDTFTTMS